MRARGHEEWQRNSVQSPSCRNQYKRQNADLTTTVDYMVPKDVHDHAINASELQSQMHSSYVYFLKK
jgi:hypothetical protein